MGSFSWTRAEHITKRANLTYKDKYKILVPIEFGGGYIVDTYYDYGYVFEFDNGYYIDNNGVIYNRNIFGVNDLYGILAYWNNVENLSYIGDEKPSTMIDILTNGKTSLQKNRCAGIDIGCYDKDIDNLKYPLKLVSMSYKGSYEDCNGRSYGDPNQGFGKYSWSHHDYRKILNSLKTAENNNN